MIHRIAPALILLLAACGRATGEAPPRDAEGFPIADRPVAAIVSDRWQNEATRDQQGEAQAVMDAAGVRSGMTVADIGAGEGYYTIRLADRVGRRGRVLAEDIIPEYRDRLAERVERQGLDNVSVKLGLPADPKLPPASFDRVFMIHMYHEIEAPYAFLWRLRPALKRGGQVVVVDVPRATAAHGTPPALLTCEFRAVGYAAVSLRPLARTGAYVALFEARGPRPEPAAISPCKG